MQTLRLEHRRARIDAGELVSLRLAADGPELVHQKGAPGWRSADTEMFPVIGPTAEADFRVRTPRGPAVQDQHGLLRERTYELVDATASTAVYEKAYRADTAVPNSKYPAKSSAETLRWPYDFRFRKTYEMRPGGLEVGFEIRGDEGMPFMLGYHPAFRLTAEAAAVVVETGAEVIPLAEVMAVGDRARYVPDCTDVTLRNGDESAVRLQTQGFGHFMLWAPVPTMICVEPITFYPYDVPQERLHEGFGVLAAEAFASVLISAG